MQTNFVVKTQNNRHFGDFETAYVETALKDISMVTLVSFELRRPLCGLYGCVDTTRGPVIIIFFKVKFSKLVAMFVTFQRTVLGRE